jgi:hypothetical protein
MSFSVPAINYKRFAYIAPASKHLKSFHAGLDPASSLFNGFRHSPE